MSDAMHQLARRALRNWGVRECEPRLLKRRENHVYAVHTAQGAPAVLRVHRHGYHDEAALRSELQWLAELRLNGLPVPQPIVDQHGDLFVAENDPQAQPRCVDMLSWMPGEVLGESGKPLQWQPERLIEVFRQLGIAMAQMHSASDQWRVPVGFTRHAWDSDGLVGERPFWGRFWDNEALDGHQRELLQAIREPIVRDLAEYTRAGGSYGLIHADLVRENVLVSDNGVALIDFDDGGFGWRMFDIATALVRNRQEADYPQLEAALISGYRSRRPLSRVDLDMLPVFTLLRSCTYLGWIRDRIDEPGLRAPMLQRIEETCELAQAYLRNSTRARRDASDSGATRRSHG